MSEFLRQQKDHWEDTRVILGGIVFIVVIVLIGVAFTLRYLIWN